MGDNMAKQEGPAIPSPSMQQQISLPEVRSRDEWQAARDDLLVEEKALMKARDSLAAKRRRLPMTPVRSDYRFVGRDDEVDPSRLVRRTAPADRLPVLLCPRRRELAGWVLFRVRVLR
jgi:hypothetical protein